MSTTIPTVREKGFVTRQFWSRGGKSLMNGDWNVHLGNIFTVYSRADRWDRDFGSTAYEAYRLRIEWMVEKNHVAVDAAIGAFAALSPNISEFSNFLALEKLMAGESEMPGYPLNIEKARRILEGEEPLRVLSGNKVRAFFLNIQAPENIANPVVVDAHMYSVWKLRTHKVTEINISDKVYHQISKDFGIVAAQVGIRPNQLQATCWSTWKRVNNIVFSDYQPKLEFV
jgi:hypothetical protein